MENKIRDLYAQEHPFSSSAHEIRIMKHISEGNSFAVNQEIAKYCKPYPAKISASDIQTQRYWSIYTISVSMWAAIYGGLLSDLAYLIRDMMISEVDKLRSYSEIVEYKNTISATFADCVRDYRLEGGGITNRIKAFIQSKIYSGISLNDIAEHFMMNKDYISAMFKREENLTIPEYIHMAKIKEAEYLLQTSRRTIADIATSLGYSSQSHFGTHFKNHTGFSPRDYRRAKTLAADLIKNSDF